jgi:membrane protein
MKGPRAPQSRPSTRAVRRLIKRAQRSLPFRVITAVGESQASNYAAALAFAAFIAMFPMILGALSIIGLAIRDPATETRFQSFILQMFPGDAQPELQHAIRGVRQSAGWLALLSLGGLVWSASGIFATMEFALTQIFGTKQRDMLRQKLMGFVMMLLLVVALGIIVAANAGAGYLSNYIPYAWVLSFTIGAAVMVALLVLLYRFVPNRTFTLREVLPGALLAGVLIEVFSLAFPLYTRIAGSFNTYGAQFGLFFLLATWLYLLSEVLLLGAVYNRLRLGQPEKNGLIASPEHESHEPERPVDVIKRKKRGAAAESSPDPAPKSRSMFQRAGGMIRRWVARGRRSLAG